jgi:hypothetical protein
VQQLSSTGQQAVNDLAQRHGFSFDATATMLGAVLNGNGSMAQFNHPEFGGSGQWMRGGMSMIGDMFNSSLKSRVDALCSDLSALVANQPSLIRSGSFQSQTQGGQQQGGFTSNQRQSGMGGPAGPASLFVPAPGGGAPGNWWPGDLGWPNSTGAQNNVRYAYFAQARRLAIELNRTVTVYDTLDHQIGGFSQQQSHGGSLSFSSQYGLVDVASLPVISVNGAPPPPPAFTPAPSASQPAQSAPPFNPASSDAKADILATIEQLADLRAKGILSDEEFNTKKAQLLSRL